MQYLGQSICIGSQCINGPLPTVPAGSAEINTIGDLVNRLMSFVMPIGVIILFFVIIWGGYEFLLSRGNAEQVKSAQAKLTTGIVGFILLVSAFFIVKFLAWIFDLGEGIL